MTFPAHIRGKKDEPAPSRSQPETTAGATQDQSDPRRGLRGTQEPNMSSAQLGCCWFRLNSDFKVDKKSSSNQTGSFQHLLGVHISVTPQCSHTHSLVSPRGCTGPCSHDREELGRTDNMLMIWLLEELDQL